jgi:hypothetical protein
MSDIKTTTVDPVASVLPPAAPSTNLPVTFNSGAIVLRQDQVARAQETLASLDFSAIPSSDIIRLGLGAEQSLQQTLDGFLARLDRKTAAKVFELFGRLEKGVEDANLPEILQRIHDGEKPGFFESLLGKIRGKSAEELVREFLEEIAALIAGRTKTLADEMARLEGELSGEMQKLFAELQALEALKKAYATHFGDFTIQAAAARGLLDQARAYVTAEEAKADRNDVVAQTRVRELQDKLRLLESRALALEGTYTRLPADQMVIQQIEQAGIATLQETATTIAARFASIKMTLLSLHGAFAVKAVQQISARQAKLDEQLAKLRSATLKDVAVAAANAPGDNRLAQAQQIEQIVASTKEIHELVESAKRSTEEKFEIARGKFEQARQELAALRSTTSGTGR